jgi:ubiquinone/menaquinone biosynthesis C-methylase UbiE
MNPWSVFWRQGHSTTFGDYFKQGYDGAVAEWWNGQIEALASNATVLEVGCGNCSLLPFLVRSGMDGKYIGVDLAAIEISEVASEGLDESGIEVALHSETPVERIPEDDASVDIVASVFGIEYSDLEQSLPEVQRVLKAGGRFAALLHHDGSIVTSMSKRAVSEYNEADFRGVIDSLKTISAARDETPSLSDLKYNAAAEAARGEMNRLAAKYLNDTNPDTANATMFELMTNALKFFKMMGASSAERQQFIEFLATEHEASRERFQQMVSVAFDESGVRDLEVKLADLGFGNTRIDVVLTNNDILAWELCTEKQLPH